MEYKQAISKMAQLGQQIRYLIGMVTALLICNGVLGALLWHQSGKTAVILVPDHLQQSVRITQQTVSGTYLEAVAMMLINDRLNMTPDTVRGSNHNLLRFVDPVYYATFKAQLLRDAHAIILNKISSTFYVNRIRIKPKTLTVWVKGQLKRWVGERPIGSETKHYRLQFSKQHYLLRLTAFQEMTPKRG